MADSNDTELEARPPIDISLFETYDPSRWNEIHLYLNDTLKYRLTVVDNLQVKKLRHATAVFLVPPGRESEYVFTTRRGLQSVIDSSQAARLIVVSFGRAFEFTSMEDVKNELADIASAIARQGTWLDAQCNKDEIPFMALQSMGERNVIAKGTLEASGDYCIEQIEAEDRTYRRLYFERSPFVVQTEVLMKGDIVNKSMATFEYHRTILAGMLALSPKPVKSCVIIGLGGGGWVNYAHSVMPELKITAVELDRSVVDVARSHFALEQESSVFKTIIGDGLAIGKEIHVEPDVIIIDVDAEDSSNGMSCPPREFVQPEYLERLCNCCDVICINVSARNPELLQNVCETVVSVIPNVYCSEQDEDDFNVVVFAVKGDVDSSHIEQLQNAVDVDEATLVDLEFSIKGLHRYGEERKSKNGTKKPKKRNNRKSGRR